MAAGNGRKPSANYGQARQALAQLRFELCRMETADGGGRSTLARRYRRVLDELADDVRSHQAESLARTRR